MTDSGLEIIPVNSGRTVREFLHLPHRLYGEDSRWIAPLHTEQKRRFFGDNPFFEHAEMAAWICRRNGVVAGRITAQIDDLYERQHGCRVGAFGLFEAENDPGVAGALLQAAEDWLRERNAIAVHGPFNLSINEETGLLVDGFDSPPFVMMGHALPHTASTLEANGYTREKDLFTYTIRPDFPSPRVMQRLVKQAGAGVHIRTLDRRRLAAEFETLRDIFNDAWADNWGFVPFTPAEFDEMAGLLKHLVPADYIRIAEVDGQPAAFIVVLPNVNEAIADLRGRLLPFGWARLLWRLKVRHPATARVPLMGVRREFQHTRLGPALAFMVIDAVRHSVAERGVHSVEMGWILEDNRGMRNIIETIGGTRHKTYRVYGKPL